MRRRPNVSVSKNLFVRVTEEQLQKFHSAVSDIDSIRNSLSSLGSVKLPSSLLGSLVCEAVLFYQQELDSKLSNYSDSIEEIPQVVNEDTSDNYIYSFNSVSFGDVIFSITYGEGVVTFVSDRLVKVRFGSKKVIGFTKEQFDSEEFKKPM